MSVRFLNHLLTNSFRLIRERAVWGLVPLCASSWVRGLREHAVYGDACPPLVLFLCASSWVQGLREHAVCGDACPPLVLFLCFDLGLGGSEDAQCVGTLVPLSCLFSFSIRIWQDVEYVQCVRTLVPLSCHLFLDLGAQRTRGVWGRLSPSRAVWLFVWTWRMYSMSGSCPECVVCFFDIIEP